MSMTFQFNLTPFGYKAAETPFATMHVASVGKSHVYDITFLGDEGWRTISGAVPKSKSGHQNFLHLLRDIMNDVDLDALGENYVNVLPEVQKSFPAMDVRDTSDYRLRRESGKVHAPGDSDRDWPEDFQGENGCYMNRCCHCEHIFHGHKRRLTCKVCEEGGE